MNDPSNQSDQSDSLDKFKRRLERVGGGQSDIRSTLIPPRDFDVKKSWSDDQMNEVDYRPLVAKRTGRFLRRLFWGSTFFFLATLVVAVYVIFFSSNIVSGNNIDLLIKGPLQIRSGDELNLQTTVVNKNKVTLNSVNLVITYPTGTMNPLAPNEELPIWREKVNDLGPGQSLDIASRAIIFGSQNSTREIKVSLEYRIPDSNALFTKEKIYTITIGSSSLDLKLGLPLEVNIGKEFSGTLKIVSNTQNLLRNCTVRLEWPNGFNFKSAEPVPAGNNGTWFLGDLIPGAEREITFTGSLTGQSGDVKPFKVIAGIIGGGGSNQFSLEYGNLFQTISLRKDFVSVGLNLADNNGQERSFFPGETINGQIEWQNNLSDKIINGTIELKLDGSLIDKRTIKASSGFYRSLNNSILWDERTLPDLQEISPDQGGETSFSLKLGSLPNQNSNSLRDVKLQLVFQGLRLMGNEQTEEVVSQVEKDIKISTPVKLVANGVYNIGPFKNTGPLPPVVGQETSYTINWVVTNELNDLDNVVVKTVLPPSMKWQGAVYPLDEKVVYNQTSGEIAWNLGQVLAGTGQTAPARQMSFQVSLLPSLNQAGQTTNLTGPISLSGRDVYTQATIMKTASAVTTDISTDPEFVRGQEIISE